MAGKIAEREVVLKPENTGTTTPKQAKQTSGFFSWFKKYKALAGLYSTIFRERARIHAGSA
jgi:antibiotic biosynthesis monooxygenase (ABM) superfamily enzyme